MAGDFLTKHISLWAGYFYACGSRKKTRFKKERTPNCDSALSFLAATVIIPPATMGRAYAAYSGRVHEVSDR